MTRILHVLDHSLPMHSGYTFRTRAILKAQAAMGLEVRGVTGARHTQEGPLVETADGLVFHRAEGPRGGPAGIREWREIAAHADAIEAVARQWRPDILHAHSPALCGQAALRAGQKLSIPVVYEIRAFWEDAAVGNGTGREGSLKYRMTRQLENNVVKRAGAVVTICNGLRDDLISRGVAGDRITIMPNGVDLDLFGAPPEKDMALAEQLGLVSAGRVCPIIGFIGSFYDYEGLDGLIAAMPAVLEQQPGARLLMVGGGPCAEALQAQAQNSVCADAIRFVGRVPHDQVERYYALADIMAYPRKKSRLTDLVTPLKPLEAMAQRKIVAASDVGGHRELISHAQTGWLFPPDDPQACARALVGLLERRADWPAYRDAARKFVETRHDWAVNVQRYHNVYQTLVADKPHSRLGAAA